MVNNNKRFIRQIVYIFLLTILPFVSNAQELSVKSFVERTNDLTASTHPREDNNGTPCALIKVQLAASGATFNGLVMDNVKYSNSEYLVYMATGSKRLTVKLHGFLPCQVTFADYGINCLESKTTYALVIQMDKGVNSTNDLKSLTPFVAGIPMKMVFVAGGNLVKSDGSMKKIKSFYICQTEITTELWNAVMNDKPSQFNGKNKPIVNVSWEDCRTFIAKVNAMTGLFLRLPDESEWEYAARGGNISNGYKFSGSNVASDVACYNNDSGPIDVAQKKPNELGLYDMCGNAWEWCDNDCDGNRLSQKDLTLTQNTTIVARGGGWYSRADRCNIDSRACHNPKYRKEFIGFRLVMDKPIEDQTSTDDLQCRLNVSKNSIVLSIDDFHIPFIYVDGGSFMMGATDEQKKYATQDEYPVHKVVLNGYYMCKEKVHLPADLIKKIGLSTEDGELFTFEDACILTQFLSERVDMTLRIPTEAEWEYAARGGKLSKHRIYSGTNDRYHEWDSSMTVNELGLIGMCEGHQEWTSDYYVEYISDIQDNPSFTQQGENIVVRGGGSYRFGGGRRRVSARNQARHESLNAVRFIMTEK